MIGGGAFGWGRGEFTDDTQMAVLQAWSLLECGGIDEADLFERFSQWARTAKDVGVQTRSVLVSGKPWQRAAADHFAQNPTRSAGNGGVMRCVPAAVHFSSGTEDETVEAARRLVGVTHGDADAGWGAAIVHAVIRAALRGEPWQDAAERVAVRADAAQGHARWVELCGSGWVPTMAHPSNGSVFGCVAEALWAVRTTESFHDAVVAAIELGGDTDTVAAVAGGVAGAIHGIHRIPSRWTTYLHGHVPLHGETSTVRFSDLQTLALQMLGREIPAMNPMHAPLMPTEVVTGVYAANLPGVAAADGEWAVVSLCRTREMLLHQDVRRELFIIDAVGRNEDIGAIVEEALETIDAFLAEGRRVVVHCHAGASRTGLVLRAHVMRRFAVDHRTATEMVARVWPHMSEWNDDFTEYLRSLD
jgi:ADP-ribosyl-[dinitrogen reductase] hydrolase